MNLSLCCYPPLPPPPPPSSVKVPRSVTSSLTSRPSWSLKDLIRRFSVNPALVFQAIRCTQPSCPCECFAPGKACLRYCETCNHGWVAHALDKLGYQQAYNLGMQVEVVQPNIVFDIASLMLYGAQATPVRLKILLDRLLSVLQHEEVLQVLHGFGWSYEDYARGYILQDSNGHVLDKWSMATRDEEHVILQQFLRFGETKAIAQEIILQDTRDKQDAYSKQTTRAESEIKKFIERSNLSMQSFMKLDPSRQMFAGRLPFVPSGARLLTSPIITPSPYSPSRDNAVRPLSLTTSPAASSTPLSTPPINRLQAYEFRRELASSASPAPSPSSSSDKVTLATSLATGMSVPTVVSSMAAITGRRSPVMESPRNLSTTPSSVHSAPSPCVTPHKSQVLESGELSTGFSDSDDEQSMGAIDYSTRDSISPHDPDRKISAAAAAAARHHRKSSNPIKRHWIPSANFGHTLIGPNGKKRVLCTACNKTFCDKGALKIHYSAVHLKEMHKCSVEGCNMMFSSRRSRNRHSANPNPKLHMPQKRKELEGLDDEGEPICSLSSLTTSLSSTLSSSPTMVVAPGLVAAHRSLEAGGLLRADPSYFMELGAQFPFAAPPGKRIKLESQEAPTDLSGGCGSEKGKDNEEEKGAPSERAATPGSLANETKDTENMEVEMETDVTADGDDTAKSDVMTQRQGCNRRKSNAPTRFAQKDEPVIVSEDHSHNQERSQLPINPFSARPTEESRIIAEADTANGSQMQQQPQDTASAEEGQTSGENKQGTGAIHFPQIASLLLASKEQREDGEEDDDDSDENELVINGDVDDRDDEEEGEEREEEGEEAATYDDNDHNHNTVSREDGGEDGDSCGSVPSPSSDGGASLEVSSEVYLAKDNPRKCALCGKLFQNQFSVKIHFQNVHLKLMHGCTVDGCTAAFPSKRSRDRHSSNLNLHRKLMSGGESGLDSSADPTLRDDILSTLYGATQLVAVAATAAAKRGGALNLQAINSNGSEEVAELKGTATLPASDSVETSQPIGAAALPPTETDDDEAKTDAHSAETEMTQNGGNGHSSEQTEEQGEQEEAEEEEGEEEEAQGNTDSTAAGNKEDEADKAEEKPAPTGRREEPMCISRKPVCCGMTFHTESALKEHYDLSHPSQPIKTGHTAATETLLASRRSRPRHKNGLHRLVSTGRKNGFS